MDGYQVTTVRSAHPARPSAPGVLIMARFKRTGGNFFAPLFAGRTSLTGTSAGWLRIGKHCALPKLGDDIFPRCCRENGCNEIAQQQLDKKQLKNVAANLTAAVCVCVCCRANEWSKRKRTSPPKGSIILAKGWERARSAFNAAMVNHLI